MILTKKISLEVPTFTISDFKPRSKKYCLIIPVINEGKKFKKVISSLKFYTSRIDIIVADGGSTDGSTEKRFLKSNGVKALLIKKGEGKLGAQYRMAFLYALNKDYLGVITMDGNGKDDPKSIPDFINALDTGYDYIQGSRFIKGGKAINTPLIRWFAIRFIFSPLLSIASGYLYTDVTNGHRAYSKKLILHPKLKLFRNVFTSYEILFYITARARRLKLKSIEIPVMRKYPKGKVPTKIIGLKKMYNVFETALKASTGFYNP